MQVYIGLSPLLLILRLQLVPAQILPTPEEDSPRVMKFTDAFAKCMCQPKEQLVDVDQEFPGEVEYIYIPHCVPLKRCSGSCMDEAFECHPTLKRNITIQMKKTTPVNRSTVPKDVEVMFVEDQECKCRLRENLQKQKSRSVSDRTKPRRKNKKTANSCGKSKVT